MRMVCLGNVTHVIMVLTLRRGETHCTSEEDIVMKADLRLVDGANRDYATAEVCKNMARPFKVCTDQTKLLLEGKQLLNRLYPHSVSHALLLHISGKECKGLENSL